MSDLPHRNPVSARFLGAVPHNLRWLTIYDRISAQAHSFLAWWLCTDKVMVELSGCRVVVEEELAK